MRLGPALVVTALLAGCGTSPRPAPDVLRATPPEAASPTWGGCIERSQQSIDYAAGARGARTLAEALTPYRQPGDHVVRRPGRPHRNPAWLLVGEDDVIHTALEIEKGDGGWLVSAVDTCAD